MVYIKPYRTFIPILLIIIVFNSEVMGAYTKFPRRMRDPSCLYNGSSCGVQGRSLRVILVINKPGYPAFSSVAIRNCSKHGTQSHGMCHEYLILPINKTVISTYRNNSTALETARSIKPTFMIFMKGAPVLLIIHSSNFISANGVHGDK